MSGLRNSAHVQEGRGRFKQPDPEATFWETAAEQKARRDLYRKLQFFCTQPWTVRALVQLLRDQGHPFLSGDDAPIILDPAAGRGHIVVPLREFGFIVKAADIYDHGKGYSVRDFLAVDEGDYGLVDLIFMNPPFSDHSKQEQGLAERFIRRALALAPEVFVLARLGFLETFGQRHELFTNHLTDMYVNTDRCDMVLGRYDPKADSATPSAWYRFTTTKTPSPTFLTHLIPPGMKAALTKPEDVLI